MDPELSLPALSLVEVAHKFSPASPFLFRNVSLCIRPREVVGLIGANGSGKTTLMNISSLLLSPTEGSVNLPTNCLAHPGHARHTASCRLGLSRSFQLPPVVDGVPVWQYMSPIGPELPCLGARGALSYLKFLLAEPISRLAARSTILSEERARAEAATLLEKVGLGNFLAQPLDSLSLGARRLVDCLRALLMGSTLFMLDEPFANVAPMGVRAMMQEIRSARERGAAGLITDHNADALRECATRCYRLKADGLQRI